MSASAKKRALVIVAIWLLGSAVTLLAPSCYPRNCEGEAVRYGAETDAGAMVDPNTWESNPIDGQWIYFPRQRYYIVEIPELGGRTPYDVIPYLSASKNPSLEGQNFTMGGGNLTEMFFPRSNGVDIKNNTCSDYYLRLVVRAPPLPPTPEADAKADQDATDGD